ncbi:MAG: hypothetical protein K0U68_13880 [Gammaproteobacteria bacterium]|nr:hypothetical protein [Gammaproteobacteria bacterium]
MDIRNIQAAEVKRILDAFVSHPLLASLLVTCSALLIIMHSFPWFFSLILVLAIVCIAMFYGQKLQLFNQNNFF